MSKVTVIGAGNVGATCANAIAHMKICSELVLLDIKEGLSEGKAIDMMQTAKMYGFDTRIKGVTNDYAATRNSNVIVITSGIPRKPGMTREELIGVNAGIVNGVVSNALAPSDVEGIVIGGHGDTTMIPLLSKATCKSMPVTKLLTKPAGQKVVAATMVGGATLTKLLGTSAWYAPGASCAAMVKSILLDEKKVFPCCCYLEGEYGQEDLCIGVPAVIGRRGCQKILEYDLTADEKAAFAKSAAAVKNVNNVLYESKILSR